jgi:hypothetical protein
MNNKVIDICLQYNQIQEHLRTMDDKMLQLKEVSDALETVEALINDVREFGYNEIVVARMQRCEMMHELCSNLDLCIKHKSVESLANPEESGLKKFFSMVSVIVKKIIEFLQDLFNTASAKCRQIIKDRSLIVLNKPVATYKKDDFKKMILATSVMKNYMDENVSASRRSVKMSTDIESHLNDIANGTQSVIEYRGHGYFEFGSGKPKIETSMTLEDAGWTVNDGTNLASEFVNKCKSYTAIGSFINTLVNEYSFGKFEYDLNSRDRYIVRTAFNANTSMYSLMAKLQAESVRQILAFYNCIDDSNVINV